MNQHLRLENIPFIDIAAQRRRLGPAVEEAVARVLAHCQFINGPEVAALEAALAAYCGAKHVVTCASGTDALVMVLMAKGVGRGDAVLCPSFTFCAETEGMFILDDAAQAFGASYKGRRLGGMGLITATSFFPAKPLGCYGDGGAIFTDDAALAEVLRSIRAHGQGSDRYDNIRLGLTGRLDTIQAAVLIEKLKIFDDEIAARNKVAQRYAQGLGNVVTVPRLANGHTSVWAQYTIRLPEGTDRDAFAAALKAQGVPTAIYYPKSMHQQTAYKDYPVADGGLPVSERLSADVIALPMHAYLDETSQDRVIAAVRDFFNA
jgi:dTDP-4-amino-4,6-dideoxygalactose transaminase